MNTLHFTLPVVVGLLLAFFGGLILPGCAHNPCIDNPRNINCVLR
jgi:hypothetical protein